MGSDKKGSQNDSRMRWNPPRAASREQVGRRKGKLWGNPNPNERGKKQREIGRRLRESQRNYLFETGMSACRTENGEKMKGRDNPKCLKAREMKCLRIIFMPRICLHGIRLLLTHRCCFSEKNKTNLFPLFSFPGGRQWAVSGEGTASLGHPVVPLDVSVGSWKAKSRWQFSDRWCLVNKHLHIYMPFRTIEITEKLGKPLPPTGILMNILQWLHLWAPLRHLFHKGLLSTMADTEWGRSAVMPLIVLFASICSTSWKILPVTEGSGAHKQCGQLLSICCHCRAHVESSEGVCTSSEGACSDCSSGRHLLY